MSWMEVPRVVAGFTLGFAPGYPVLTVVAGVWLTGYYWLLIAQWILRSFAAACLRGWK